jgi:hypothetical protein
MIVMDYNNSIARRVNIELDSVHPGVQCRFEGQKRILGVSVADAAVGDYFRNAQLVPSGEVLAR